MNMKIANTAIAKMLFVACLVTIGQSRLFIANPQSLADQYTEGELAARMTTSGWLPMGTKKIGQVISPLRDDQTACNELNWEEDFTESEMAHFNKTEGFFLLVKRGGCSFQKKIQNAEKFGAEMVLISDLSTSDVIINQEIKTEQREGNVFQPHLPSFEIYSEDADKIYKTIKEGSIVYIKAIIDNTHMENKVEVDLWYASSLDLGDRISDELAGMAMSS